MLNSCGQPGIERTDRSATPTAIIAHVGLN